MSEPKVKIVNQTETSRDRVRLVGTGNLHKRSYRKRNKTPWLVCLVRPGCLRSELVLSRNQIVAAHYELFGNFQKKAKFLQLSDGGNYNNLGL